MRTLVAAMALAVSATSVAAAPVTKADLMAKAAEAVQICATSMPDSRVTRHALTEAGFRKEHAADPKAEYFSALGYRMVAIVNMANGATPLCAVVVAKATPDDAEALLRPVLNSVQAKPFPAPQAFSAERAWIGVFKRGLTVFFVKDRVVLGPIRGAAAVARSLN